MSSPGRSGITVKYRPGRHEEDELDILIVLALAAIFVVSLYNRLVGARNAFKNAFAQIDVQLTRRYDLIPNLVETAKGYLKHERETLEAVIRARNTAMAGLKAAAADPGNAAAVQQLSGAEGAADRRARQAVRASPRPIRISRPTRT